MIRSTKHTLKYTNKGETINKFVDRYREMVGKYVNIIWNNHFGKLPTLLQNDTDGGGPAPVAAVRGEVYPRASEELH